MNIQDLFRLDGKVAVVTGSSKGLGKDFAIGLAEAGADLVINSRHGNELEECIREVRDRGVRVLSVEGDITIEDDVAKLFEKTVGEFGKVDILVNNAATGRTNKSPAETSHDEWDFVINTNLTGTFLCAKTAAEHMKEQKSGKIINISSISGQIINRYFHGGSYDVSKTAVRALTRALAVEWAPYNIQVNAIAPGYYETEPNLAFFDENPAVKDKVLDMIPQQRLGNKKELAGLIVCLASSVSNYMTGSTIVIDGGYTLW